MKLNTSQIIRRHRNGSIDTAYYVQRGHVVRSLAAHRSISRFRDIARNRAARWLDTGRKSPMEKTAWIS